MELPQEVKQAGARARELTYGAATAAAAEPTVTDALRQRVQEAYANNTDITNKLDTATSQYFTAPAEGRVKYQDIFNPFQREQLTSQYTQQAALPMLSLSSILGNRLGRIDDLIGAGTRAYGAQTGRQVAEAQLASGSYQDLLNEYQLEQAARARQEQEQLAKEQFAFDKWLQTEKLKKDGSGSGDPFAVLKSIAPWLFTGGQSTDQSGGLWEDQGDAEDYGFLNGPEDISPTLPGGRSYVIGK